MFDTKMKDKETSDVGFPKLMVSKDTGWVCLMLSDSGFGIGLTGLNKGKSGKFSMTHLRDYDGEVTLSNKSD